MCSCLGRPREHLNRSIVGSGFTQFHNRFASKMAPSSPPNARISPGRCSWRTFRVTKPQRSPSSSGGSGYFGKSTRSPWHGRRRRRIRHTALVAACHGRQIHPMACEWQAFPPVRARNRAHYHLWRPVSKRDGSQPPVSHARLAKLALIVYRLGDQTSPARLVELVDTLGLGPSARAWGFESLTGHHFL